MRIRELLFGEITPETLATEVKASQSGVLRKNYGLFGGDVYFVNPAPKVDSDGNCIPPTFKTADILNHLDHKPRGRQPDAGLKYLLGGGDFIIAKTDVDEDHRIALAHHQLFFRSLTRPADYIQSTLNALDKFLKHSNGECSMRSLSTIPLRNSIANQLFDLDEITPEFNLALQSFTGLTEDKVETLDTTVWTKLELAYYGWIFRFFEKIRNARHQYVTSVDQVISGLENKILADLNNYKAIKPTNIISMSIIQMISDNLTQENPLLSDIEIREMLGDYLESMTLDNLQTYLSDSYIRTLPAVISPADMIMIPTICTLTQLASNPMLQQQLREDIASRKMFADIDAARLKSNIDSDIKSGGLLHRVFLESLRREYTQKDIKELERSTLLWRYCEDGMMIGDEVIPPHSLIAIMNALQRFDKDIWHNPEDYDPGRFKNTDNTLNRELESIVMSIFTDGRRKCPANRITEYIFQAFIGHIVANYQLDLITDKTEKNIDNIRLRLTAIADNSLIETAHSEFKRVNG